MKKPKSATCRQFSCFLVLSAIFLSFIAPVKAQTEQPRTRQLVAENAPNNQKRLALVIGNADYKFVPKLKNAANDAIDIGNAFSGLGFEVIQVIDQDKRGMQKAIREFGDRLYKQNGVGVFFYAGHGVQYNGRNYLIPVDADIPVADEVEYQAVEIDLLLRKLELAKNDLNIVILDACRNNPFAKEWSESRAAAMDDGLAKIAAPKGTVFLYSTEPGKTALDGDGRNGTFTEALLEQIKKPDLEFDQMYKVVARRVQEKSKNKQFPYKEGSNVQDFFFGGTTDEPTPGKQPPVIGETDPAVKEKEAATREKEIWDTIKNSSDAEQFRIYLEEFPVGANAARAKLRREQIMWDSVKLTKDKAKLQEFLKEFPSGANSSMAKIKLRQIEVPETVFAAPADNLPPKEPVKTEIKETETAKIEPAKETATRPVKPITERVGKSSAPILPGNRKKNQLGDKYEVRKNSIGIELVNLPAGSFMMGLSEQGKQQTLALARKEYADFEPEDLDNEKPYHKVVFDSGFWIGKTEITQAQWRIVMGENPSAEAGCDACPVERVSWETAKIFVKKLNELNDEFEYRLPSEAEWEYAARAGTTALFAGKIDEMSWHSGNSQGKTHPVEMMQANNFGLFDMYGNVEEWCEDLYSPTYEGLPVDGSANTETGNAKFRVVRGGSWNNFPTLSRSSNRKSFSANAVSVSVGFRVAAHLK